LTNPYNSSSEAGGLPPAVVVAPPGPECRRWLERFAAASAPMGPCPPAGLEPSWDGVVVYREGRGSNVIDVDGNRYVDLAAGFGSLLLGHDPEPTRRALAEQSARLLQSLGDVHPSDVKIELLERVCALYGEGSRCILGQSGADALTAALKTAALYSGRPGVIAFRGAYHGLSYAPLALCGLRDSYRVPFAAQLNPRVRFAEYPLSEAALGALESWLRFELERGDVGAIVYEPIAGRAGCLVPPAGFGALLSELARRFGALLVADEVWTGLGRSGHWLYSAAQGTRADLICLGKGLGGGLPISACVGRGDVMQAWCREAEVVHTSTFAGAPLACAAALATLRELEQAELVARAFALGRRFAQQLELALPSECGAVVRGSGLMIGVDLGPRPGLASVVQRRLLQQGYIVSTGGGTRQSVVLTPSLAIAEPRLEGVIEPLTAALREVLS
jgi:4-aminobutyrate aminotransferase / (S)-3-amino-2-methylpropionate transaminase / 5-aminovalerate transaminase